MNSKYKVLASNTIIFAIGNILVKLISFFLMPLYTSILTVEEYGVAELLNNSIEIVLPIVTLCIIEALYRFSIDKKVDHSTIFINTLFVIVAGDIIVLIGTLICFFVFQYKDVVYFLLLFVTTTFYKLTTQFSRGLGHIKRYAFYGVLNSLLLVSSNIILLFIFKGGVNEYLLSFSIGYGVSGCVAMLLSNEYRYIKVGKFDKKKLKEMLNYSLPNIPNMLSWWVNSLSDRYIVLIYWGTQTTGLYTAASKLPAMINLVTSIFQQAWQYSAVKEIESKDNSEFYSNIFRGYSYVCIVACSFLLTMNKLICRFLLKESFYVAWKYVSLLLLAATFGCIATYFGTFYNAVKKNGMLMISTVSGSLVNLMLNFLLIPLFGAMGAAIATMVSYFIIMIIRMIDVNRFIEIYIDYIRFIIQFILLFVSAVFSCFEGYISLFGPTIILVIIFFSDFELLNKCVITLKRVI